MQNKTHDHDDHSSTAFVEHSVALLKKAGARITKPRLAVLGCLAGSRQSLSPKDILNKINVGRNNPDVDLATIYRILDAFSELGLVHRVGAEGSFMACAHLECGSDLHMVAYCAACDKIQEVDLPGQVGTLLRKHVQNNLSFRFGEHFFQITGICLECTLKRKRSESRV